MLSYRAPKFIGALYTCMYTVLTSVAYCFGAPLHFCAPMQQNHVQFNMLVHIMIIPIMIIVNFYSHECNTRCHSIGHNMRIARIKIRVDSHGRWERA